MKVRKTCLVPLLGISLFISSMAFANELSSTGRWIVKLSTLPEESWTILALGVQVDPLNVDLGIYLITPTPPFTALSEYEIAAIKEDETILYAQQDFLVQPRTAPNDPELDKQWALSDNKRTSHIDAQKAWRKTTGGKTALGDDIVVAIIDDGVDVGHIDLADNIWVNPHEIPDNGIDDDGNGFVDDVHGYNSMKNNGEIPAGGHGTHVAGIVGAVGDNSELVSGVNWNVKIMPVYYGFASTSDVLLSYSYVLEQKKLWIQSQGREGANIVATNSSFGHNFADCTSGEYPAWDDLYNEMGKVGILSAVATMNIDADVDEKGDVPSGCLSPYLIKVTNTDRRGRKAYSAAYGLNMVDIGAPGSDIHSTLPRDRTGYKSGTSMATPHVAGAIALVHAAASRSFAQWYLEAPDQAALHLKETVLTTVTPLASLKGKTRTGGLLNVGAAVEKISKFRK